jgi:hypothetical protein
MNKEHMLILVRANQEMEHPERFTMETYVHNDWQCTRSDLPMEWCGTPACLLGNFAARTDLQPLMCVVDDSLAWVEPIPDDALTNGWLRYCDERICKFFDITEDEAAALFSVDGCDKATTRDAALAYVEDFMAEREGTTAAEREATDDE